MWNTIHQRRLVQQKVYYQYHKYQGHDREILRHGGFGGRTGIVSTHAKQDCKVQSILKWFIFNGSKWLK